MWVHFNVSENKAAWGLPADSLQLGGGRRYADTPEQGGMSGGVLRREIWAGVNPGLRAALGRCYRAENSK